MPNRRSDEARKIMKSLGIFWFATGLAAQMAVPSFETEVLPILVSRCQTCHSGKVRQGGLSLETRESVLAGGNSGPAIAPGRPADSLLLTMVASGVMPKAGTKLTTEQTAVIRRWIESADAGRAESAAATTVQPTVTVCGPRLIGTSGSRPSTS